MTSSVTYDGIGSELSSAMHRKALLHYWGTNFTKANGHPLNRVPVRLRMGSTFGPDA